MVNTFTSKSVENFSVGTKQRKNRHDSFSKKLAAVAECAIFHLCLLLVTLVKYAMIMHEFTKTTKKAYKKRMTCANKFVPYTMEKQTILIREKCTEDIQAIHFTHLGGAVINAVYVFVTFAAILDGN